MKRRNFIKTGLIFVPSYMALGAAGKVKSQSPLQQPAFVGQLKPRAAAAGTWYDQIAQASTTDNNASASGTMIWSKIAVGSTGPATALRIYIGGFTAGGDVKMALYNSSGSLMDDGISAVSAGNQYVEVSIDDGDSLSVADYWVAWEGSATVNVNWRYASGFVDGDTKYEAVAYASFPPASLPTGATLDWHFAAGVKVN